MDAADDGEGKVTEEEGHEDGEAEEEEDGGDDLGTVRGWEEDMATTAMDFMGCTGMGSPKRRPVEMLWRAARLRLLNMTRASVMGMYVLSNEAHSHE